MRSIQKTLLLGTLLGTAGTLLAAGALIFARSRTGLIEQMDRSLADRARFLASTVEFETRQVDLQFTEFDLRDFGRRENPSYLQVWQEGGPVLFRSASLAGGDLERFSGLLPSPGRHARLPDGRDGRAVGIRFVPKTVGEPEGRAPELTLVLAQGIGPIQATLSSLRTVLVSSGLLALAVSAAVLWAAIRRGLWPLRRLADEIARLDTTDLSSRVTAGRSVTELGPVTERVNELLARMQSAIDRERSFSADVAHELRTPLSGLLSVQDVTLSRPREAGEYRQALGECRQITVQMQRMVENLLMMARLEAGQVEARPESLVPNEALQACWRAMHQAAEARGLGVRWELGPDVRVSTDPSLFQIIVRNVIENAIAHSGPDGQVVVRTSFTETRWEVRVSNPGSRLSQEQAEKVFERFWRGDAARSATGVHCGLGLSLVRKAMGLLGGSVEARSEVGREFEISLAFPKP